MTDEPEAPEQWQRAKLRIAKLEYALKRVISDCPICKGTGRVNAWNEEQECKMIACHGCKHARAGLRD